MKQHEWRNFREQSPVLHSFGKGKHVRNLADISDYIL